jgi:thiamine-phosphate pyrophosphorylase
VISNPKSILNEAQELTKLFESGLVTLHLRKPGYSQKKLKALITSIPKEFHNRIIIHSHYILALRLNLKGIHLTRKQKKRKFKTWWILKLLRKSQPNLFVTSSVHSIHNLAKFEYDYNYVFLSPIFNSISKGGYAAAYSKHQIIKGLENTKYRVFALGGLNQTNIHEISNIGFTGGALLGCIWKSEKPCDVFRSILKTLDPKKSEIKIKPVQLKM